MIEQAIYGSQDVGGYRFLGRSPGFVDEWLPLAERLCTAFGERPAGVSCLACVFARPFGDDRVAVVQVADQGADDAGRPGALGFRLLVLPRPLYEALGGDPFHVAERFPPRWDARGELPVLEWAGGPPPRRTVAEIETVLKVPYMATLLGGAQALLDGGRLVFERTEPATPLLRSIWALLPTSTRIDLWPASFAFSNALDFHVLVVPRASGPELEHYVTEDQAGDYPEGRYELNLQIAVEAGDQAELDGLFARRSRKQTLRLGVALLLVFMLIPIAVMVFGPSAPPAENDPPPEKKAPVPPEKEKAPLEKPGAKKVAVAAVWTEQQRLQLARRLHDLGERWHVALPADDRPAALTRALVFLDATLDAGAGKTDSALRPGEPQAFLRALLRKHGVGGHDAPDLGPVEMIDRLEEKLASARARKEPSP